MRNSRKGRFRVWDRSQDAFNGEDLVYNFDVLDELIGGANGTSGSSTSAGYNGSPDTWLGPDDAIPPSAGTKYPGSSNNGYEVQSGRRTLYSVVSGLNYNDVPLGTIIMWWRPNSSVPIPDGWTPCDGRTVLKADHSFTVTGSITTPDLRNKFVVGADSSVPGINAVDGYALETNATPAQNQNNNWTGSPAVGGSTGAPGIGYDSGLETSNPLSGSNVLRNISHSHTPGTLEIKDHYHDISHTHIVPRHKHRVAAHDHDFSHVHLTANHVHDFTYSSGFGTSTPTELSGKSLIRVMPTGTISGSRLATPSHTHDINMNGAGTTGGRRWVDGDYGLFVAGPQDVLWGLAGNPKAMTSGYGYQYQAVTSFPTWRRHSGNRLNAHEVRQRTDSHAPNYGSEELFAGSGWGGVVASGEIRTLVPSGTEAISGGITATNPVTVPDTKKLLGTTSQENIYVNIRPQYIGMLYLMKVKVSTNII